MTTEPWPGENFLLPGETGRRLYHEVVADLPIIDFHNHLDPQAVLEDRHWQNLGQAWLEHDHYKWRIMRWHGVEERCITGSASDREKFDAFAATIPYCLGNPIYHWSHLELARYFGLDRTPLSPESADHVWDVSGAALAAPEFGARGLLRRMNVRAIATTDDPCDDLDAHRKFAEISDQGLVMRPTFRPDPFFKIGDEGFASHVGRLSEASGLRISSFDDLLEALIGRLDHFVAHGCRAADHGIEKLGSEPLPGARMLDEFLGRRLIGGTVEVDEANAFQNSVLVALAQEYYRRDLVMLMHVGALRNNSSSLMAQVGTDAGGDSIDDAPLARPLNLLLDRIEKSGGLPRTILHILDPAKNEVVVSTAGNFQRGSVAGRIQPGAAWWFNDQIDGMERQMIQLSQMGLLWHFIGMVTDSRSFLSFPRHEYFRRLLCRMIGDWIDVGEVPGDMESVSEMLRAICFENARQWFLSD